MLCLQATTNNATAFNANAKKFYSSLSGEIHFTSVRK